VFSWLFFMAEARLSARWCLIALFHDRSPPRGARDFYIALFHGRSPPSRRIAYSFVWLFDFGSMGQRWV